MSHNEELNFKLQIVLVGRASEFAPRLTNLGQLAPSVLFTRNDLSRNTAINPASTITVDKCIQKPGPFCLFMSILLLIDLHGFIPVVLKDPLA